MLSKEDNELVTRVGPGTPMGQLMRHYWIPGMLSSELAGPDCDPVRVRLLGEDLIAFRDTKGQVGVLANHCPHRGASLFFGRNEEAGLRCVYHGWKFDVGGRCLDMPNEPPESNFKDKIRAVAYPCQERGGIIWTYMGLEATPPPLPDLEANMLPAEESGVGIVARDWVPIDDDHMLFVSMYGTRGRGEAGAGVRRAGMAYRPNSTDWLGRWRLTRNRENDYLVDREKQRQMESFTGIEGILTQDQAVTESMGGIYDRSDEHLAASDSMIIRTRRRMLDAVRALRDEGVTPPGADDPTVYRQRTGG